MSIGVAVVSDAQHAHGGLQRPEMLNSPTAATPPLTPSPPTMHMAEGDASFIITRKPFPLSVSPTEGAFHISRFRRDSSAISLTISNSYNAEFVALRFYTSEPNVLSVGEPACVILADSDASSKKSFVFHVSVKKPPGIFSFSHDCTMAYLIVQSILIQPSARLPWNSPEEINRLFPTDPAQVATLTTAQILPFLIACNEEKYPLNRSSDESNLVLGQLKMHEGVDWHGTQKPNLEQEWWRIDPLHGDQQDAAGPVIDMEHFNVIDSNSQESTLYAVAVRTISNLIEEVRFLSPAGKKGFHRETPTLREISDLLLTSKQDVQEMGTPQLGEPSPTAGETVGTVEEKRSVDGTQQHIRPITDGFGLVMRWLSGETEGTLWEMQIVYWAVYAWILTMAYWLVVAIPAHSIERLPVSSPVILLLVLAGPLLATWQLIWLQCSKWVALTA